jgi:hypothetical protein
MIELTARSQTSVTVEPAAHSTLAGTIRDHRTRAELIRRVAQARKAPVRDRDEIRRSGEGAKAA